MLDNYTNIALAITQWCNRSVTDEEFQEQIINFIFLAEQQMFIDCSTLLNQITVDGVVSAGSNGIEKLADWGRTLMLLLTSEKDRARVNNPKPIILERVTFERGSEYQKKNNLPATPVYYTDFDYSNIIIIPAVDQNYIYELTYYGKFPPLSPTGNGVNVNNNSLFNPDTLFYCALSKAYAYLHNKEESMFYDALYKERVAALLDYDKNRLLDRNMNATTFNDVY